MATFHQIFFFRRCHLFLFDQIKRNRMHLLHWKTQKNRCEPNELNKLKYYKLLKQMTSYAHWNAWFFLHAQIWIKTFMYLSHFKTEKKNWPKWAKWAGILKKHSLRWAATHFNMFFSICMLIQTKVHYFIDPTWNWKKRKKFNSNLSQKKKIFKKS